MFTCRCLSSPLLFFQSPPDLPVGLALFDRFALVEFLLAADDADSDLDLRPLSINPNRHYCQALVVLHIPEVADLVFAKDQAADPERIVAARRIGRLIRRDAHLHYISLAAADRHVGAVEDRAPGAQGFDLKSEQFDTSLVVFEDFVVEMDFFVF